jgi:hypothetical protein
MLHPDRCSQSSASCQGWRHLFDPDLFSIQIVAQRGKGRRCRFSNPAGIIVNA